MLGASLQAPDYIHRLQGELNRIDQAQMRQWADLIFEALEREKFDFIFGDGG